MRTLTIAALGILAIPLLATRGSRAGESDNPRAEWARQQHEAARAYAAAVRHDAQVRRWLDEEQRRNVDVDRARQRLALKQLEWQRWGDRKAYRRLLNAQEDLVRAQRLRDETVSRNRQLLGVANGGAAYPPVGGPPPGLRIPGQAIAPGRLIPIPAPGATTPDIVPTPASPVPDPIPEPGPQLKPPIPSLPGDPIPEGGVKEL